MRLHIVFVRLFFGLPKQSLNFDPCFSDLLVDVHAAVKDKQDPGDVRPKCVENVVALAEYQPPDTARAMPKVANFRICTDRIPDKTVNIALKLVCKRLGVAPVMIPYG